MRCDQIREAMSAAMDGEEANLGPAVVDAHLAGCAGCRAFAAGAADLHRRVRVRRAEAVPDLTTAILAAAASDAVGRPARPWARYALVVAALAQLALAVPPLVLGDGPGGSVHLARELGSWDVALAVSWLAVDDAAPAGAVPLTALGRWLTLAGAVVAGGTAVVALTSARGNADRLDLLRPLMAAAAGAGVLGVALTTLAQTALATGRDLLAALPLTVETATASRPGVLTLARGGLLAVALVATVAGPWRRRPAAVSAVVAGSVGATFVASALAGHPWTTDARLLAVAADVFHGLAVTVWAGGLVALVRLLRRDRDGGPGVGAVVGRFSSIALVAAAVVGVTGTASAWLQLAELEALWATGYGRLVLAKVTGFAVLVALGWLNRARLVAAAERSTGPLLRSVRAEVVTAALVIGATAVLVDAPPARVTADRPFDDVVVEEDASLQLTVEPARVGTNDLHLYFYDRDGTEPLAVDAVQVEAAVADLPPRRLAVEPVAPTHVSVYDASFTTPGRWAVTVTAVRAGRPTVFSFGVPVT